jgi:hypothetical protein
MKRLWIPGVAVMAILGVLVALAPAADPKDDPKAKKASDDAGKIAMAFQLADIGRTTGSAEALIAAAKLLNSVEELTILKDVKSAEGKDASGPPKAGDAIKGKEEGGDFSKEVKDMLADAEKLAKNDEHLMALIKGVKVAGGRNVVGGARVFSDTIQVPGNHRVYTVDFVPGLPATVSVSSNSGRMLNLEVWNRQGELKGSYSGRSGYVTWTPSPGHNPFTVRITNTGREANTFTVTMN